MKVGVRMKINGAIRGQTITEIALVIGVVGLALIGMEAYLKRGIQAKVRAFTNYVFDPDSHSHVQRAEIADKAEIDSTTSSFVSVSGIEQASPGGRKRVLSREATSIVGVSRYEHTSE